MDDSVDIRLRSATRCEVHRQALLREAHAVGESQAAQLIVFVVALTGLLLVLDVGLRRAHRASVRSFRPTGAVMMSSTTVGNEEIRQARHTAVRSGLTDPGMDFEVAERGRAAWEAEATRQRIVRWSASGDLGDIWVVEQRSTTKGPRS